MLPMTNDTALDTSITEPSMTAGEVEMLLFALDRSRAQFAWKVGGLDAEALNRPHPPSAMTLAGIFKAPGPRRRLDGRSADRGCAVDACSLEVGRLGRRPGVPVAFGGRRFTGGAPPALA